MTVPLDVLSLNRGDHATLKAIVDAITRNGSRLGNYPLVALQEMYSVPMFLDQLEEKGFMVWRGDRGGSRAAPVVWDPEQFQVKEKHCFPLLPAGKRAGTYNMAKSLNLVVGQHIQSHRRVAFGSGHNIHRQWVPGRGGAAEKWARELVECLAEFECAQIVGIDSNTKPTGKSLAPVRKAPRLRYSQLIDKVVTHGKGWAPDGFVFKDVHSDNVMRFVAQRGIYVPGTDHKGLSARFTLKEKS